MADDTELLKWLFWSNCIKCVVSLLILALFLAFANTLGKKITEAKKKGLPSPPVGNADVAVLIVLVASAVCSVNFGMQATKAIASLSLAIKDQQK